MDDRFIPKALNAELGFPQLDDFAKNLKGRLLLTHGMLDDVAYISGTLRIVEALKNANKSFDMLLLPNGKHMADAYAIRRGWDYLVEHLLGEQTPEDFELKLSDA